MALTNRTLLVIKYLWQNTDEDNSASLVEISSYLVNSGLPKPDPRSLKKDIEQLIELGIDIVCERKVQNRYSIVSRFFDTAEIKLLIDAIQSSRFITTGKSKNLIKKLAFFINPGQKSLLKRQLYIDHRTKASNEHILIIVDRIFSAIAEKKQITFKYFDYNQGKNKIHRHRGKVYTVSPYDMIWNNDYYYFTAFDTESETVKIYRADRIDELLILEKQAVRKSKGYRVEDYHTKVFSMYMGPSCEVELLCENALMNSIIDRFGEKVHTEVVDSMHFLARTTVALSDVFYGWVFASAGKMKIISPKEAVAKFNFTLDCFR